MVTIADWIIVAATIVTALATLVLAIITKRTLDESKRSRELAARVALMSERLKLLDRVEELVNSVIERPGIEKSVMEGLFGLEKQVEYLFGSETVMAYGDLTYAIGKLDEETIRSRAEDDPGHWFYERKDPKAAEASVFDAHHQFQTHARNLMTILPYRGSGLQGITRHGWPNES